MTTYSILPKHILHSSFYHCYEDYTQVYLSFQPEDPNISAEISVWLYIRFRSNLWRQSSLESLPNHQLITVIVISFSLKIFITKQDYCNSLLARLPASVTKPLQIIQNVAAGLFCSSLCTDLSYTLYLSLCATNIIWNYDKLL